MEATSDTESEARSTARLGLGVANGEREYVGNGVNDEDSSKFEDAKNMGEDAKNMDDIAKCDDNKTGSEMKKWDDPR